MKKKYIIGIAIVLVVFCVISYVVLFKIARVPTAAMANTILQEDRVLISKVFGEVKRGDIVSFKYPKDHSVEYVKRIVGLPGEKIEIKSNKVFINGKELAEQVLYVDFESNDLTIPMKVIGRQKIVKNPLYTIYLQDTNEKDITELVLYGQKYAISAPFLIPDNNYFMLGDNRDYSQDSRYWGAVSKDLLTGKVVLIYRYSSGQWIDVK